VRKLSHRVRPTGNAVAAAARVRRVALSLCAAAVALSSSPVLAEELDLGLFLTPIGRAATLRIEAAEPDPHGTFRLGLTIDYAHDLLDRGLACGGIIDVFVEPLP